MGMRVSRAILGLTQLLTCEQGNHTHFTGQEESLSIFVTVLIRNTSMLSSEFHQQEESEILLCLNVL